MTAFVLAGGLGTRIAGLFPDLPKSMIPVAGRPFIDRLIERLHGFEIVLCAGHRAGALVDHVKERGVQVVVEAEPLGTAGALAFARRAVEHANETFLALNGDTYAEFDPGTLVAHHRALAADATIACYRVEEAEARGTVEIEGDRLVGFREKESRGPGWVSGGVYALEPHVLDGVPGARASSLEIDVFPALLARGRTIGAWRAPGQFWDMGTPEGLRAAEERLS
jgi:NDP-sugar pyrophosphorylase family protein